MINAEKKAKSIKVKATQRACNRSYKQLHLTSWFGEIDYIQHIKPYTKHCANHRMLNTACPHN
jgi:hypothetical protein